MLLFENRRIPLRFRSIDSEGKFLAEISRLGSGLSYREILTNPTFSLLRLTRFRKSESRRNTENSSGVFLKLCRSCKKVKRNDTCKHRFREMITAIYSES